MKEKLFFDNDIILDISIERDESLENSVNEAVKLMNLVESGEYKGYTSTVIFTNTYYIQRKLKDHNTAVNFLKKLRLILTVLNVDDKIIQKALESGFNDFEDAVQYYTAIENNMDYIITRNTDDYKKSIIKVYTPSQYIGLKKRRKTAAAHSGAVRFCPVVPLYAIPCKVSAAF
jgi:predicted nucleic acid-binding protein